MTVHHSQIVQDCIVLAPDFPNGGRPYQVNVGDLLEFADWLRRHAIDTDALVYSNDAIRPQPILGLQVIRETAEETS